AVLGHDRPSWSVGAGRRGTDGVRRDPARMRLWRRTPAHPGMARTLWCGRTVVMGWPGTVAPVNRTHPADVPATGSTRNTLVCVRWKEDGTSGAAGQDRSVGCHGRRGRLAARDGGLPCQGELFLHRFRS